MSKFEIDDVLTDQYGFTGKVGKIYPNYQAAVGKSVHSDWYEAQEIKPTTPEQPFYLVIALKGHGSVLVAEEYLTRPAQTIN